jgi:hypothetical protein
MRFVFQFVFRSEAEFKGSQEKHGSPTATVSFGAIDAGAWGGRHRLPPALPK